MRRGLQRFLALAAPQVALVALGLAIARFGRDPGAAQETIYLALWASAALLPLALPAAVRPAAPRSATVWAPPATALAVGLLLATWDRGGGSRAAIVAALLVLALALVAARQLRPRRLRHASVAAPMALATAVIAYGHRLFAAPADATTWLLLALLPALASAVAARLARRDGATVRPVAALVGASVLLAPLAARETWWCLAALAVLAALSRHRACRRALAGAAVLALVAGSFPWLRPQPISVVLQEAFAIAGPTSVDALAGRSVVLSAASPRLELDVQEPALRSLTIDSYLTNSGGLSCAAPLARLEIRGDIGRFDSVLLIGRDSAEWAASRPDVMLTCPAPPPWIHWIPRDGRFLGRTTRARIPLATKLEAAKLVIERDSSLPENVSLAIFRVGLEP